MQRTLISALAAHQTLIDALPGALINGQHIYSFGRVDYFLAMN